ncbi:MAG: DUF2178 domain-containing protein [Gemmatimonadota bacterium]
MSQTRLRAWLATVVWSVAGIGFFLAFFSGGGAADFDTDSRRHMLAAVAIGFGFLAYWTGLWVTRRKGTQVVADERDFQVVARASQITLIIVLVLMFLFCTVLWLVHESAGVLDVGWMWFLAYGCMVVALVTNALMVLVLDRSSIGRG